MFIYMLFSDSFSYFKDYMSVSTFKILSWVNIGVTVVYFIGQSFFQISDLWTKDHKLTEADI